MNLKYQIWFILLLLKQKKINLIAKLNQTCISQPIYYRIANFENVYYLKNELARFPALILRLKAPKATCLIFENGKMVITGTKTQN